MAYPTLKRLLALITGAAWGLSPIVGTAKDFQIVSPLLQRCGQSARGHCYTGPVRPANPRLGDVWINPKDRAAMVFVAAGPFLMGDPQIPNNPPHTVTLSGYWIYKNLVTVGQYQRFCRDTGHIMPPAEYDVNKHPNHPIVYIRWIDARAYCAWADVRLPTEAEWEKAARGTDGRKYPWGDRSSVSKPCTVLGHVVRRP